MASDVITLNKKYQTMIQKLLNYSNYPGISFQQLEQFKQNFRNIAFTCRVWSCPYATLGFNNIDSLSRHEAEHSKHICRVQGCQYPVFSSARLLKNHVTEHHTSHVQHVPRNSIRKRPAILGFSWSDNMYYFNPHAVDQIESPEKESHTYILNCICGNSEDYQDSYLFGNTIRCATCATLQHILCYYPENQQAMRANFSHSCIQCKPISQATILRNLRLTNEILRQKRNDLKSQIAPLLPLSNSPRLLAADTPRQATPRMVQASPPPPNTIHQNSQMVPQVTTNSPATNYALQDYQIRVMLEEEEDEQRERERERESE